MGNIMCTATQVCVNYLYKDTVQTNTMSDKSPFILSTPLM